MPLSHDDVANLVKRTVQQPVLGSDKKTQKRDPVSGMPVFKDVKESIQTDEVLDFALRGNELTVVTTSGEKLTTTLTDADLKKATAE